MVLRHRGVRDLLTANFLLYTAVSLQAAALMKEVYDISGRKADLGWIGLAEFLPSALLVLVTGPLADRMDRKKMALCAIAVELLATALLLWYSLSEPTDVKLFFAIAFLYGIGRAFYDTLVVQFSGSWPVLLCEVNLRPRNDASLHFHHSIGFREVGQQETDGGKKTVSLLALPLSGE